MLQHCWDSIFTGSILTYECKLYQNKHVLVNFWSDKRYIFDTSFQNPLRCVSYKTKTNL